VPGPSLKPRCEPYWLQLGPGAALGYRKVGDGKPGRWLAKWSAADARTDCGAVKRHHTAIGVADDLGPAEGLTRLSFEQARQKAFAWFTEAAKDDGQGTASDADSLTVKQAVEEYFADCFVRDLNRVRLLVLMNTSAGRSTSTTEWVRCKTPTAACVSNWARDGSGQHALASPGLPRAGDRRRRYDAQ
jgi:hypothetical protein